MKFCTNCGNHISAREKFCSNCGAEVESEKKSKNIWVCPICNKTKIDIEGSSICCSNCNIDMIDSGVCETDWNNMSPVQKETEIKQTIDFYNYENNKKKSENKNKKIYVVGTITAVITVITLIIMGVSGVFHTHTINERVIAEPTCINEGINERYCENCNYTYQTYLDKTDHVWEQKNIIEEPTCTEDGLACFECKNCKKTEERTLDELGHDWIKTGPSVNATCISDGYYTCKCSRCGTIEKMSIPSGHKLENKKCVICGYEEPLPDLRIGQTKFSVEFEWGKPIEISKHTSDRGTTETWWYKHGGKTIGVFFDADGKVEFVNY